MSTMNPEAEKAAIRAVWQRAIAALSSCDWPALG